MAGEEMVLNFSEFMSTLPPQIIERLSGLVLIFKAAGIAMIAYMIYIIVIGFINFRRSKRIKFIEERVVSIDNKLNKLIKGMKSKK
ncbi:MAG: hypothetical protein OEL87_01010 [Nanoarchaeota archaeon]|nr:hypothetical protein [Nanoarchaeota archaeon]